MPGKDRDEESGKYTTSYQDSDFLDAIRALGGFASTTDVADEVGCTRRTAYTRLRSIEEDGRVHSRQIGNSLAWTVADD